MIDYYLKFANESEADKVLADVEGSIDVIGKIPNAVGWHVNVRGEENVDLEKYAVEVATPYRVWA
jgi:thiamine biosynthesis lipoprotein ApbE